MGDHLSFARSEMRIILSMNHSPPLVGIPAVLRPRIPKIITSGGDGVDEIVVRQPRDAEPGWLILLAGGVALAMTIYFTLKDASKNAGKQENQNNQLAVLIPNKQEPTILENKFLKKVIDVFGKDALKKAWSNAMSRFLRRPRPIVLWLSGSFDEQLLIESKEDEEDEESFSEGDQTTEKIMVTFK